MTGRGALRRILREELSALAAAGLVVCVALWAPGAAAQTTAKTLADLFDGVSIPGLDSLPVGNVQITDAYKSADISVHGQTAAVVVFKPAGAAKNVVAVVPNNFSLTDFVPLPPGTPLDGVTFSDMAFVIAQAATSLTTAAAPPALTAVLSHSGETAELKKGLNLIGRADFSASGTVKDLLSYVGITDLTLPLNGGLPANLFSQNPKTAAANFKNQILDNLDLKLPLPTLAIPGIPDTVSFKSTQLTIKGENDGGTRGIDVDVAGELDVTVKSQKVAFDYEIDVKKQAGKPAEMSVNGQTEAGKTITVDLFQPFTLDSLSFSMTKETAGWKWQVAASTEFRSKPLDVSYLHDPANANSPDGPNYLDIHTKLTLAEIVGKSDLPGLDDIRVAWLQVYDNYWRMSLGFKGTYGYMNVFKPEGASKHLVAITIGPESISPAEFIPGASNSPLKDVSFQGLSFVLAPRELAGRLYRNQLPRDIAWRLRPAAVSGNIVLKAGLNVFGKVGVHPSGEMETLLRKVGISEVSIPLHGGFSKSAFGNHGTASIKNAILDALDLRFHLPPLNIPEIDRVVTFRNGHLTIKGKDPKGKRGIYVDFGGEADFNIGGSRFDMALDISEDRATKTLTVSGKTTRPWSSPFGVSYVSLNDLAFTVTHKSGETDVRADAKARIGRHSNLDVDVKAKIENGAVTDESLTITGPIDMSEIPGVKDIPEVNKLVLASMTVSKHGFDAITTFNGRQTDLYAFTGSGWNVALAQKDFTITEVIPPLRNTPLKHISFDDAAILYSADGLSGAVNSFGPVAEAAFKDIYGDKATDQVTIQQGLNLIATFDHKKAKGGLSGGFKRMGMAEEKVVLIGDIGGLLGSGSPHVNLSVDLAQHGRPKGMPKWMNFGDNTEFIFSMTAIDTGDGFVAEFGIGMDVKTKVHGDELIFDGKLGLEIEAEAIEVKFILDLKTGTVTSAAGGRGGLTCTTNSPKHKPKARPAGWHKPFGIPGFTLYDVMMDLGIDEDGAIHLGFGGGAKIAGDRFCIVADADLLPEALGAPQDIAFVGEIDEVPIYFLEQVALSVMEKAVKFDMPKGILPEFNNVKLAFATAGAEDPDLHITGEGFTMAGGMKWLGHQLGSMDVSVSPATGIYANGKIDDLNLGPLHLKNNDFTLKAPLKSLPSLKLDSNIAFLGISERFKVDFNKNGVKFKAHMTFGPDFIADMDVVLSGVDLSATKPSFRKADFYVAGDFEAKIADFLKSNMKALANDLKTELNAKYQAGKKKIDAAKKKVDGLDKQINHERAVVRAEKKKAERKINAAENRVNRVKGDLSHAWQKYHHCHGWGKVACKIEWGITIAGEKAALRVADGILDAARGLIEHVPLDFDPRIWPLIAAKDAALVTLNAAEKGIDGLEDIDNAIASVLNKVAAAAGDSLNINKASFQGDLRGIIEHDTPVDLGLHVELFKARFADTFTFKLKDIPYDAKQLGLMGIYGLDHLIDKELKHLPAAMRHQLHAILGRKMDSA